MQQNASGMTLLQYKIQKNCQFENNSFDAIKVFYGNVSAKGEPNHQYRHILFKHFRLLRKGQMGIHGNPMSRTGLGSSTYGIISDSASMPEVEYEPFEKEYCMRSFEVSVYLELT